MEITKEQIKRLANAVKAMQEETLIDDDVSGGYQPDPFKDAYAEIYTVIDECERGLNVNAGENTLPIQRVSVNEADYCKNCSLTTKAPDKDKLKIVDSNGSEVAVCKHTRSCLFKGSLKYCRTNNKECEHSILQTER